jgi:DNA-binding transcriptional MerR regulator
MPITDNGKPTYLIREACERIGRSRDAVMNYIRKGLTPDVGRNYRGDRVFTDEDIERFRNIAQQQKLKKLGKLRQFTDEPKEEVSK